MLVLPVAPESGRPQTTGRVDLSEQVGCEEEALIGKKDNRHRHSNGAGVCDMQIMEGGSVRLTLRSDNEGVGSTF
jgi:hypothetical protein